MAIPVTGTLTPAGSFPVANVADVAGAASESFATAAAETAASEAVAAIPSASSSVSGLATAAQITKLDALPSDAQSAAQVSATASAAVVAGRPTLNGTPITALTLGPGLTSSVADGVGLVAAPRARIVYASLAALRADTNAPTRNANAFVHGLGEYQWSVGALPALDTTRDDSPIVAVSGNTTGAFVRVPFATAYARRTPLDQWIDGYNGALHNRSRALLNEATVICPLFARDRYWDAADSFWKSRNYGLLSGGLIVGDATVQSRQLPYTDRMKGVRYLTQQVCSGIQIPNAWLNADGAFTILVRYQRPVGTGAGYPCLLALGDIGGGVSVNYRVFLRQQALNETEFRTNGAVIATNVPSYNPKVIAVTGATGGAGAAVNVYVDGALAGTGTKMAGTLATTNHMISGGWPTASARADAHFNILDVIIIPRVLTATEIVYLTQAVQYPDAPHLDLISGQSNGMNPASVAEVATLPATPIATVGYTDEYNNTTWDRGWSACAITNGTSYGQELTIAAARPGRLIAKFGQGGTAAAGWIGVGSTGNLWIVDGLMRVLSQLNCRPTIRNFVFTQGETDAENGSLVAATYQGYLTSIAAQFRLGLGFRTATNANLRFVIARLNTNSAAGGLTNVAAVQAGQDLFATSDVNARVVNSDACALKAANVHYSGQGILDLGALLAAQMQ